MAGSCPWDRRPRRRRAGSDAAPQGADERGTASLSRIVAKSEAIDVYRLPEAKDDHGEGVGCARAARERDDMDYLYLALVLGATFVIVFMVVAGTLTLVARTEAGRKRRRVLRLLEHSEGRG